MEDNMSHLSRPQMFLFGCTLRSDKKEFRVEAEDEDTEHQLSLKAVCLGAEADDVPHTVELEGLTFDGKKTKVPLVVLKPSVLPSVSLGGFEVTPPVVFRLQSGSGPVHISGQHFVIVKESDDEDEEENNSSPVKRPSSLSSRKQPAPRGRPNRGSPRSRTSWPPPSERFFFFSSSSSSSSSFSSSSSAAAAVWACRHVTCKTDDIITLSPQGKAMPKTEQKFENFAKSSFRLSDATVVKDLWSFVQTLKGKK
uniref:Nucleophosmin n=1 Tax=Gadus morhua TaxID=8049 RepID=A0A8C4YY67_GADMO